MVFLRGQWRDQGRCGCGGSNMSFIFPFSFTCQHCPSYRLQWWSCPGATQWETPFSKEGLSELALVGGSRNPWVRRIVAVSIDTNNTLVSFPRGGFMCSVFWVCFAVQVQNVKLLIHISNIIVLLI